MLDILNSFKLETVHVFTINLNVPPAIYLCATRWRKDITITVPRTLLGQITSICTGCRTVCDHMFVMQSVIGNCYFKCCCLTELQTVSVSKYR